MNDTRTIAQLKKAFENEQKAILERYDMSVWSGLFEGCDMEKYFAMMTEIKAVEEKYLAQAKEWRNEGVPEN